MSINYQPLTHYENRFRIISKTSILVTTLSLFFFLCHETLKVELYLLPLTDVNLALNGNKQLA